MDELQHRIDAQAKKLDQEFDLLDRMLDSCITDETVNLVLSQAKRVGRESKVLVQRLAQMRDTYSREAQGNYE